MQGQREAQREGERKGGRERKLGERGYRKNVGGRGITCEKQGDKKRGREGDGKKKIKRRKVRERVTLREKNTVSLKNR